MEEEDIPQVAEIEREAFSTQWPWTPFKKELQNRLARYLVAVDALPGMNRPAAIPEGKAALPAESLSPSPIQRWLTGLRQAFSTSSGDTRAALDNSVPVFGYVGLWFMVDEAHVTSIAVRESYRRRGIGELLLMSAIDLGMQRNARVVSLEVRVSNLGAQALYEKYGFGRVGLRKGYYSDNHEDAYVMTTDVITSAAFQSHFQALKDAHLLKWGGSARQLT